jgi:hypothetical protein
MLFAQSTSGDRGWHGRCHTTSNVRAHIAAATERELARGEQAPFWSRRGMRFDVRVAAQMSARFFHTCRRTSSSFLPHASTSARSMVRTPPGRSALLSERPVCGKSVSVNTLSGSGSAMTLGRAASAPFSEKKQPSSRARRVSLVVPRHQCRIAPGTPSTASSSLSTAADARTLWMQTPRRGPPVFKRAFGAVWPV